MFHLWNCTGHYPLTNFYIRAVLLEFKNWITLLQASTNFTKIYAPSQNSTQQKGDMKQVSREGWWVIWSKFHTGDPQILGTTVQNSVTRGDLAPTTCAPMPFHAQLPPRLENAISDETGLVIYTKFFTHFIWRFNLWISKYIWKYKGRFPASLTDNRDSLEENFSCILPFSPLVSHTASYKRLQNTKW